ncbi:transmembrane protein, putative [Bodo saltans]|uniref:Transmembrane protein, putative n=1 Tax=Bodo saltans TaxID=75058 RepID=A0A0S4ITD6_BODSA|nr:transmembrane protein, putative [Bodo saltans]|eukprot:CUE74599.1 transmembrane protein, putative [Bodo saltans]
MCDMNFGSNKSLCGKRCSGLLRSLTSSTVQVAPGLSNNQEAATFVCSTASLTSLFSDLYYNQGVTGWQYVASNTGVTRTYPAAAQSGASCASQDVRQQAWYVSASTGPKDIIFVLDYSNSMNAGDAGPNGMSRLTALKITMNLLLTSLTPADRFNIVTFSAGATIIGPKNALLAATPGNITAMNNIIQAKQTKTADFGHQCAMAPPRVNPVQQYYNWIAQGILRPQPRWTNPRNSTFGQGLIVTVSQPIFDYSVTPKVYIGVAAIDVLYSELKALIVTVSQPIFDYSVTPKVYIGVAAIDVLYSELKAVATDVQIAAALKGRSEVCLDYDLTGCQRQNLRLNATVPFSCSQDPAPSTCTTTNVVVPSCNTTIVTNINQVLCEPYNNYTVYTQNDTKLQCCQQAQCFTKSHSTSITMTVSKELTKSRTKTPTPRITPSPSISFTPSSETSDTETKTLSLKISMTPSDVITGTELLTKSFTVNKTYSESVSQSLYLSMSLQRNSGSSPVTVTESMTTTNSLTPSGSLLLTQTRSVPITLTEPQTATRTWPCVSGETLRKVFNFSVTVFVLTDQDIVHGFNRSIELPALKGLEMESLHLPWFETFTVPLTATLAGASKGNSDGFALMPGITANITATFVGGLGTTTLSAADHDTIVNIACPPHPDFAIYIAEAVELQVRLSDLTLGQLCNTTAATAASPMFMMIIDTPNSILLNAGQTVITTTLILAAPAAAVLAAPDMQVLIMTAMIPCANSYQQRSFALFRAISPFAISDSFEGVLWGNLIANVGFLALHGLMILIMSVLKGMSVSAAAELARFPNFTLHMFVLTYPGTAFSTLQLFIESGLDG